MLRLPRERHRWHDSGRDRGERPRSRGRRPDECRRRAAADPVAGAGARRQPQHGGGRVPAARGRRRGGDARPRRDGDRHRARRRSRRRVAAARAGRPGQRQPRSAPAAGRRPRTSAGTRPRSTARPRSTQASAAWAQERLAEDVRRRFASSSRTARWMRSSGCWRSHLTRGDAVAVEDPCFLAHISTLRLNGFAAAPVAVDALRHVRRTGSSRRWRPGRAR